MTEQEFTAALTKAREVKRLAEEKHSSQESVFVGLDTIINHERHCCDFDCYCKDHGESIAEALLWAAPTALNQIRLEKKCEQLREELVRQRAASKVLENALQYLITGNSTTSHHSP